MADVAHHFTDVRGDDERETILRLMVNRLVSFDGKAPHGSWAYAWDGTVGKGAFTISLRHAGLDGDFPAEWSCQCGGRWELFAVSELQQQELHQQHPLQPVAKELAIHSSQVTWRVPGLCRHCGSTGPSVTTEAAP